MFRNWFFKKFFKKQFAIARFISTYANIPVKPFLPDFFRIVNYLTKKKKIVLLSISSPTQLNYI